MKQRSPIAATLLSLFIPIYILYWFYVTADDMRRRGGKPPKLLLLFAPIIGLIVLMIIVSAIGNTQNQSSRLGINLVALVFGVLCVAAVIIFPFLYYYRFSEAAEVVTSKKVTKGIAFILFLFVSPAAVYIIQEALNETAGTDISTDPSVAAPTPSSIPSEVSAPPTDPTS